MISRQLLALRSVQRTQVRGKAISNYKRPSMDLYLAPTEAYGPANAKRQSKYNMSLLLGTLSLAASIVVGTVLDVWEFNPYPYKLVKQVKGTVAEE